MPPSNGNICRLPPVVMVTTEAAMELLSSALDKFHVGVSEDGRSCMMMFVDETNHTIHCVVDFDEFNDLVSRLNHAADEMARRRTSQGDIEELDEFEDEAERGPACGTFNVAFAEFQRSPSDQYIEGALIGDTGEIVGIRMCPEVACQLTKAMLLSTPEASSC